MTNNGTKFVRWSIFVWVVAIVTSMIGVLFIVQISLMNNLSEMKSDIATIKTDVSWIVKEIDKSDLSLSN